MMMDDDGDDDDDNGHLNARRKNERKDCLSCCSLTAFPGRDTCNKGKSVELLTTTTWMSQNPKRNPKMRTFDANQAIRMMVSGTKTKHAEEGRSRTLGKRDLISQI